MIVSSIRDFKKQITEINNRFGHLISEFMGINIKFSILKSEKDKTYNLGAKGDFITYTKPLNEKISNDILSRAGSFMTKYIDENDSLSARLYNDFIDEVSMSLIFENYIELDEEIKLKQLKFVEELKNVSFKTYECNKTNMGIIFIPEKVKIESIIAKFDFEYIDIKNIKSLSELIESEKPMLKIVDNKSVALVINSEFYVSGIIKKKQGCKSIHQVFEDRFTNNDILYLKLSIYQNLLIFVEAANDEQLKTKILSFPNDDKLLNESNVQSVLEFINRDSKEFIKLVQEKISQLKNQADNKIYPIKYISIRNMEISYYGNENFLLTHSRGKWKIKQYSILLTYIFEYIIPQQTIGLFHSPIYKNKENLFNEIDGLLNKICKIVKIMKNLSSNNNGALFIILNNNELDKSNDEYLSKAIPDGLVRSDNKQMKDYKSIIRNNSGSIANILDIDNYLLESIASVDGATILDEELNIISFSEIVNIKGVSQSKKQNVYGARTTAAISASKYGLAIKVSEDGYIEVYKDKKFKMKI